MLSFFRFNHVRKIHTLWWLVNVHTHTKFFQLCFQVSSRIESFQRIIIKGEQQGNGKKRKRVVSHSDNLPVLYSSSDLRHIFFSLKSLSLRKVTSSYLSFCRVAVLVCACDAVSIPSLACKIVKETLHKRNAQRNMKLSEKSWHSFSVTTSTFCLLVSIFFLHVCVYVYFYPLTRKLYEWECVVLWKCMSMFFQDTSSSSPLHKAGE